jgi:ribokinase
MPRIVVVGSTNIDLTFPVPRLPRSGETLAGLGLHTGFGGKGANQAVMAARLGANVHMISAVGGDDFGRQALASYRTQNVDTTFVRVHDSHPTGTAAILVDEQAHNCIIVVAGANAALTPENVLAARVVIESADVLLTQLETPLDAARQAFRLARAAGVRTVLNPAPAAPLPDDLLALTDLCIPNETELETLIGRSVWSLEEAEAAGRELRKRGPAEVIVTLGARGALVVGPSGSEHCPSVAVRAVDPTAAGDAFIGSLAVFLAQRISLSQAVRRASAVAALTVTRSGAQSSFPAREEIEAFLAAQVDGSPGLAATEADRSGELGGVKD